MNVTREVILDLLPLYLAGEASPATRELVEEFLKGDRDLAERVRVLGAEGFAPRAVGDLAPEAELKSLRRAKRALTMQRWLFALGIAFTAMGLATRIDFRDGRVTHIRLLLLDYPLAFGVSFVIGLGCLIAYHVLRRRRGIQA